MPEAAVPTPTPVPMPRLGATMDEGLLLVWLKAEGERVEEHEPLFEVETDKAVVEVESPVGGVVERLLVPAGALVAVGDAVALVATGRTEGVAGPAARRDGVAPAPPASPPVAAPSSPVPAAPLPTAVAPTPPSGLHAGPAPVVGGVRLRITPAARKLARELGLDAVALGELGRDGARITRQRVAAAALSRTVRPSAAIAPEAPFRVAPAAGGTRVELTPMRRAIARVMSLSAREIPQFSVTKSVDMGLAAEASAALSRWSRTPPTLTDFVIHALAGALTEFPALNAHMGEDGVPIRYADLALGLATATEGGIAVPVLHVRPETPLGEIGRLRREAVAMAMAGRAGADVATFTLSNLGPFGVDRFVALVNPPQVAILAAATAIMRPVVADGAVAVRLVADLTLSADHRAVDGVDAARFLAALAAFLADEGRWRLF